MAINIGANFDYKGKQPNFARDSFATKAAMKAFAESSIDDGHLSYCAEDKNIYIFKSSNTIDSTTGRWRLFQSGSSITVDSELDANSTNPVQNKVIYNAISDCLDDVEDNYAKKTDISTVYKYKGSKSTYSQLPTIGNSVGDVWNIDTADANNNIKAGDNVVWTGDNGWDNLSGIVDISGKQDSLKLYKEKDGKVTITTTASDEGALTINTYGAKVTCGLANFDITTESGYDLVVNGTKIKATLSNKVDNISGKGLSTNDYTTNDKTIVGNAFHKYTSSTAPNQFVAGPSSTAGNLSLRKIVVADLPVVTGATNSAAGTAGIVPAPAKGQQTYFLKGDGTWAKPTDTTYSLPIANASTLGGIKVGTNLTINSSSGMLSVDTATSVDNGGDKPVTANAVKSAINTLSESYVPIDSTNTVNMTCPAFSIDATEKNDSGNNTIMLSASGNDVITIDSTDGINLTSNKKVTIGENKYPIVTTNDLSSYVAKANTADVTITNTKNTTISANKLTLKSTGSAQNTTIEGYGIAINSGMDNIVLNPGKGYKALIGNNEIVTKASYATTDAAGVVKIGNNLKINDGVLTLDMSDNIVEGDNRPVSSAMVATIYINLLQVYQEILDELNSRPKQVVLTQAAYDALTTKDSNTIYYING